MRNVIMQALLTCAAIVAVTVQAAQAEPLRFYVSPDGNDAWAGKSDRPNDDKSEGPFATLAHARDAIRALKASGGLPGGGVEVEVLQGTYSLAESLAFSAEDSGTKEAPVVYRAADGNEVRLVGGKVIPAFAPVTDAAVVEQLDESARGHVVQADLKALGIEDFGSPGGGGIELFFNDKPMTVSRWPNEGFVRIKEVVGDDTFKEHGIEGIRTGKWTYEEDRPARRAHEKDLWVHGYWFWDYRV